MLESIINKSSESEMNNSSKVYPDNTPHESRSKKSNSESKESLNSSFRNLKATEMLMVSKNLLMLCDFISLIHRSQNLKDCIHFKKIHQLFRIKR
jgi:hypothetical protein